MVADHRQNAMLPLLQRSSAAPRFHQGPLTKREVFLLSITVVSVFFFITSQGVFSRQQPYDGTPLIFQATTSSSSNNNNASPKPLVVSLADHAEFYQLHLPPAVVESFRLHVPETTAYRCPESKTIEEIKDNCRSQQGEDLELLSHFQGLCGGRYIELGALDGETFSNSWLFRHEFDWKGGLIEMDPANYKQLLKKRKRDEELFVALGPVCPANTTVHYVTGHEAVSGVWEYASDAFRQKWWPDIEGPKELTEKKCIQLQALLDGKGRHMKDSHDLFMIDFLSLDVEGSEWAALQTIDWKRTHFGVILVETPDNQGTERDAIVTFLQEQGYRYLGEKMNSLWFLHGRFHEIYEKFLQ